MDLDIKTVKYNVDIPDDIIWIKIVKFDRPRERIIAELMKQPDGTFKKVN